MNNKTVSLLRIVAKAYNRNFRQLKKYYNSLNHIQKCMAKAEYNKIARQYKIKLRVARDKEKINAIS